MAMERNIAYNNTARIMAVKRFIMQTPGHVMNFVIMKKFNDEPPFLSDDPKVVIEEKTVSASMEKIPSIHSTLMTFFCRLL